MLTAPVALAALGARGYGASRQRVCLIGHTGRGNYGHDWDTAFRGFANVEMLAVADPDAPGRARARARSGAPRSYADFRGMLEREHPDIVAICTRWPEARVPMVRAAAQIGAHVLMEKPFAATVEDADALVQAAGEARIRIQVGHTTRTSAVVRRMVELVKSGEIGDLIEIRTRGKEDRRAGGEDMMVLGTHLFDLMRMFAGDPRWAFAHVTALDREISADGFHRGSEPVGPIAGNRIAAMLSFDHGVHGYFGSTAGTQTNGPRFGFTVYGTKGVMFLPLSFDQSGDPPAILRSPNWRGGEWTRIAPPVETRAEANASMVRDLLDAIEKGREPACSAVDGRWTVEMVTAVYQSQLSRRPVDLPLLDRHSPAVA